MCARPPLRLRLARVNVRSDRRLALSSRIHERLRLARRSRCSWNSLYDTAGVLPKLSQEMLGEMIGTTRSLC